MVKKYDLDKDPDYIAYMEELHAASDKDFQALCDEQHKQLQQHN